MSSLLETVSSYLENRNIEEVDEDKYYRKGLKIWWDFFQAIEDMNKALQRALKYTREDPDIVDKKPVESVILNALKEVRKYDMASLFEKHRKANRRDYSKEFYEKFRENIPQIQGPDYANLVVLVENAANIPVNMNVPQMSDTAQELDKLDDLIRDLKNSSEDLKREFSDRGFKSWLRRKARN